MIFNVFRQLAFRSLLCEALCGGISFYRNPENHCSLWCVFSNQWEGIHSRHGGIAINGFYHQRRAKASLHASTAFISITAVLFSSNQPGTCAWAASVSISRRQSPRCDVVAKMLLFRPATQLFSAADRLLLAAARLDNPRRGSSLMLSHYLYVCT